MKIDRRDFVRATALLAGLAALPQAARAVGSGGEPILYRVRHGQGTVYILGFAEATDDSWFAPKIANALDAANVLWLETPPGSATAAAEGQQSPPADPELQRVFTEKGFDADHDLFQMLPPDISIRTAQWADKLGIARTTLSPMRPWFARIQIQQAYSSQRQAKAAEGQKLVFPERVVVDRARARGIPIQSEYPTLADLLRFFANLQGPAQPQYIQELLDYFDRDEAGTNDAGKYGWITGKPSTVSIDLQRTTTPDLYRAMHVERNSWWTGRIEGMLAAGETAFIMIGGNHVLGPDSIPEKIRQRGLSLETL
jgi:uncharacterized protein YbaP (TraB family)